jgi:hypothetical protein
LPNSPPPPLRLTGIRFLTHTQGHHSSLKILHISYTCLCLLLLCHSFCSFLWFGGISPNSWSRHLVIYFGLSSLLISKGLQTPDRTSATSPGVQMALEIKLSAVSLKVCSRQNRYMPWATGSIYSKHSILPWALGDGKKPSSQFKILTYLFHTNSDEERLYITFVHLNNIHKF